MKMLFFSMKDTIKKENVAIVLHFLPDIYIKWNNYCVRKELSNISWRMEIRSDIDIFLIFFDDFDQTRHQTVSRVEEAVRN